MRTLILISIVAVILSSCAGVQNTAYTDDLYYIPQDKNQQLPAKADEQTSIVENKEALNYKKQESYDGFAESYNDQEEEYQESYIATDYTSRLRRFHGVYVYDPYYLLDPWYYDSWRYPSYGFGYYPTVGIGWNSYWGFNLGFSYNWYTPWYGYYPYGGSYWSGYHDGYWSANYRPTNRYTGAFTHRSGFNNYSTKTSAGTNATNRKRGSASQAATTNNLSRKNTNGNALSREVNSSGNTNNLTRTISTDNTRITNNRKVNTTFTRPASGSNSNARSYYNLDHNIRKNTSLINNSRSIQPNTNTRVGITRQNQSNRTPLNLQQNNQNFRQPSSRPNQNSTNRTNRTIQNNNNQRNYTPGNNSGTRSNMNQSSPSRSSSSGNNSRNSSSGSSSSPRRR